MRKLITRLVSRIDPEVFDEHLNAAAFDTSAYKYSAYKYEG